MKFCKNCGNMYYTKLLSEENDKLIYYCRKCGDEDDNFGEDSNSLCVSKTHISGGKAFSNIINEYTKLDPTLPRIKNIKCPNVSCESNKETSGETKEGDKSEHEIIYLRYDDIGMKYVYLCTTCDHSWKP
jgi:DNA-directed RNA polymerase subunit M/transcription elongation factor TFIIS